jgi:hypothetical protein
MEACPGSMPAKLDKPSFVWITRLSKEPSSPDTYQERGILSLDVLTGYGNVGHVHLPHHTRLSAV